MTLLRTSLDGAYAINASRTGFALTFPLGLDDPAISCASAVDLSEGDDDTKINMLSSKHRLDASPLLRGCECYCCQRHSRAYIHHLIQTHEILGSVLLHIHNIHHMLKFFDSIRLSIRKGVFSEYVKKMAARRVEFLSVKVWGALVLVGGLWGELWANNMIVESEHLEHPHFWEYSVLRISLGRKVG